MVRRSDNKLQHAALGILFVVVFSIQLRLSWDEVQLIFYPQRVSADVISIREGDDAIAAVSEQAKAAGVRPGDRVLNINERSYTGLADYAIELKHTDPGSFLKLRVERGDEVLLTHVTTVASPEDSVVGKIIFFVFRFVTPLFAMALGFFVAFQRPFDRLAWLVLFLMLSFSQVTTGTSMIRHAYQWDPWLATVAVVLHGVWTSTWPVSMLFFGVYFPERFRLDLRWPWLKWVIVAPVLLWGVVMTAEHVLSVENFRLAAPLVRIGNVFAPFVFFFFALPISCFFYQLGEKSGTLPSRDARRRLRLLWFGTGVSLTPLFVGQLMSLIRGSSFDSLPQWFLVPALLLQFVFPLTLAYVIVVQRAMEVNVALRTGLKYTLAQGGVTALRVGVAAGMIALMVYQLDTRSFSLAQRIAIIAVGGLIMIRIRSAAQWLSKWVDRRFFRETYNSEHILAELSDNVRSIVETQPLLETVAERISLSLHVPKIALLLRAGGAYEPAYALGFGSEAPVAFNEASGVVAELRNEGRALPVYLDDPESWTQSLDASETGKLSSLSAELILPLAVKDKLHGFIVLSQKQSEEPYSRADLRLLQSVATQTGLALENSQLTAAVASEVAQRERLNRELEIAREVQQRLFPQRSPVVAGLDYAGHCRPAQGVGGDYYDFLEVPDGHFGIAVGDVSGKGIPAALLMASLQASLRGQAISSPTDLAGLMTNMNRLVYDASPSNRYATFFYGQYEPRTRTLVYVNGGHNAPMLFRGTEIIRLDQGGPVVGLFAAAKYDQATVQLAAGDTLVAFTDGISEAMNAADDEFGEEGMIPVVLQSDSLPAQRILDRLFEAADAFAAGAPQHDDMTAVVIRVV